MKIAKVWRRRNQYAGSGTAAKKRPVDAASFVIAAADNAMAAEVLEAYILTEDVLRMMNGKNEGGHGDQMH